MADQAKYTLIYWPGLPGRGEFIRLAFEYSNTSYTDAKDAGLVMSYNGGKGPLKAEGTYPFAPPLLKLADGSILSQTPNILMYLGEELGLAGSKPLDKYIVNQITLTLLDFNNAVHDTHHPIASSAFYEEQKEEALKKSADFRAARFPKFINYFEGLIQANPSGMLYGSEVIYADLVLYQMIEGLHFAYPECMASYLEKMPGVLALHNQIRESAGIKKYNASGRKEKFAMGVFRHYPELDGPAGPVHKAEE